MGAGTTSANEWGFNIPLTELYPTTSFKVSNDRTVISLSLSLKSFKQNIRDRVTGRISVLLFYQSLKETLTVPK